MITLYIVGGIIWYIIGFLGYVHAVTNHDGKDNTGVDFTISELPLASICSLMGPINWISDYFFYHGNMVLFKKNDDWW